VIDVTDFGMEMQMGRPQASFHFSRLAEAGFGVLCAGALIGLPNHAIAFDPATDHTCVWNCDGPSERRTITIWIEPPPRLGQPQVVWQRPSAEGATQSGFVTIDNDAMKRELNDWSQTSWQFYGKAQSALERGACNMAATYLQEALKRNPPANELGDIRAGLRDAEGCIRKFHKTPDNLALIIDVEDEENKVTEGLGLREQVC
jgi:hypothetical protein